ncbi:hypothetical protein Bbelb_245500 [Branchiostoma belcheri]|nr:hypothetical protein Bbelb_245500 [Branchiostoma belcheri]
MAAAPSSLGSQFREELSCSICLELFTRPKVLPCQHTFCQGCLQDHAGRGGTFQCPNCRQQVRLPPQGVAGLPDNHLVSSLCERLQGQATLSEETREQPQSENRCSAHPSEKLKLYCTQCQKLTEQRDGFLAEAEQQQRTNDKAVQDKRDMVLADVNELFAACDCAEQEMEQERERFLGQGTALTQVVGKYRRKTAPTPVQTQHAVFQPTDTPVVPVLGSMMTTSRVTFGGVGGRPGEFKFPSGVAVSEDGEIFVADNNNKRIQAFTLQGTFVHQFPTVVSGEETMSPQDVAVDWVGNLWVVGNKSSFADHAVCYTKQGKVLRKFGLKYTKFLSGVTVHETKNYIHVTHTTEKHDYGNDCVYVYNEDGQFLFKFGSLSRGSDDGQLMQPTGICTDRAGNIIVADRGNSRVELFDKTGRFLRHIITDMEDPQGVAMGPQGQLVVTYRDANKVAIGP